MFSGEEAGCDGVKLSESLPPYIYGNTIDSNFAQHYGGGIANESNYSVTIENNIISHDSRTYGGSIYIDFSSTNIVDNQITNNTATASFSNGAGGGIYADYSYATKSVSNTIAGNTSNGYGGAVYINDGNMKFINTIIYNNPTAGGKPVSCSNYNRTDWHPTFNYCDVEKGAAGISYIGGNFPADSIWQANNQSADPQFTDADNNYYQLSQQSICIDAGPADTSGLMLPFVDVAGNSRIVNDRVDIGCYEFTTTILPVKLLSFTAALQQNEVAVNWAVSNNPDVSSFEVEESADGKIFTALTTIDAAYNQNGYYYTGNVLTQGYNYYRLKVTEKNGNQFYSGIAFDINTHAVELLLYPNPATDEIHYRIRNSLAADYTIRIYNTAGKVVRQSSNETSNLAGSVMLTDLPPGKYFFEMITEKKMG